MLSGLVIFFIIVAIIALVAFLTRCYGPCRFIYLFLVIPLNLLLITAETLTGSAGLSLLIGNMLASVILCGILSIVMCISAHKSGDHLLQNWRKDDNRVKLYSSKPKVTEKSGWLYVFIVAAVLYAALGFVRASINQMILGQAFSMVVPAFVFLVFPILTFALGLYGASLWRAMTEYAKRWDAATDAVNSAKLDSEGRIPENIAPRLFQHLHRLEMKGIDPVEHARETRRKLDGILNDTQSEIHEPQNTNGWSDIAWPEPIDTR